MIYSDFIKECEKDDEINLTNFMYLSNSEILAEYCLQPYKSDCLKLFFSMTKSISSIAIGIASDLGLFDLDDLIINYFKDELPINPHENLSKIQIHHLLSMTSGIHNNTYDDLFVQDNWIKAYLSQDFPHEPGTFYRYSTHGSHMLSAIIQRASGMSLEKFLNKYLFFPMDIREAQWEHSPEGITAGGMGLSLYPSSLAKLAQLLLNKGVHNNKRLISQEYISNASSCHAIKQESMTNTYKVYIGYEYGFQFHISKNGYYRADGAFGQLCLICPQRNVAFIAFSQRTKMEKLLSLIYKYFIEAPDEIIIDHYVPEINNEISSMDFSISNMRYKMENNPLNIEYIEFYEDDCNKLMTMTTAHNRQDVINFNLSAHTSGKMHFIKDLEEHDQSYICKTKTINKNILELTVFFMETPYVAKYMITFDNNSINLEFSINVSFTLNNFCAKGKGCV